MSAAAVEAAPTPTGPLPGVQYPLKVLYCGNCSLPLEVGQFSLRLSAAQSLMFARLLFVICLFQYCEYYPDYDKCKQWLEKNMPNEFERVLKLQGL